MKEHEEQPGEERPDEERPDEKQPDEAQPGEQRLDELWLDDQPPDEHPPDDQWPGEHWPGEQSPDEQWPDDPPPGDQWPSEQWPAELQPDDQWPGDQWPDDQQPDEQRPSRWSSVVAHRGVFAFWCVALLALLLAAYSNHYDNDFHFDDGHVIRNNIAIRSLHNTPQFFADPHTFSANPNNATYRPLLTLSYALDYWRGGGLDPPTFHRTQFSLLLVLWLALVLLFKKLLDLAVDSAWTRYVALFAATLFCVHTANTQTVNYLSARSSLVATLAVVLALLAYIVWPGGRRTQLFLLPVVIGGLAKPLTVMFAPILFVFILFFEEETGANALGSASGWRKILAALMRALPSFVVCGLLFFFLSRMDPDTIILSNISRWDYLRSQPFVWLHYGRLFFLPVGLTADTDWKVLTQWYDTRVVIGLLFVGCLLVGTTWFSLHKRLRPVAFGLAWFCLALLPTSSIVPLSEIYNEHRIFFPYVGLTLAATWLAFLGLARLFESRPASRRTVGPLVGVLVLGVLLAHAAGTHTRNRVWKDGESLWGDVAQKSPTNGRGLMNYGLTLMRKGEYTAALEQFNQAKVYAPNYMILENNLGIVKAALGRNEEAEAHFLRSIRLRRDYAPVRYFYANWLAKHARGYEAITQLETAVALSPTDPGQRTLLLRLYVAAGNDEKALPLARDTLTLAPSDDLARAYVEDRVPFPVAGDSPEDYRVAGRRKVDRKEWLDAAAILRHALRLEEASAVAWNNLGWARLQLGFPDLAAGCFSRALELDPSMTVARNNLRAAQKQAEDLRR